MWRFVDADLTDDNWRHLAGRATPRGIDRELDLARVRELQARFRHELDAIIGKGARRPGVAAADPALLIERRFNRLKRALTAPPEIVRTVRVGSLRTLR